MSSLLWGRGCHVSDQELQALIEWVGEYDWGLGWTRAWGPRRRPPTQLSQPQG
jgi:hypothetical protein